MGAVAAGNAATGVGVVYPDAECVVGDEPLNMYTYMYCVCC